MEIISLANDTQDITAWVEDTDDMTSLENDTENITSLANDAGDITSWENSTPFTTFCSDNWTSRAEVGSGIIPCQYNKHQLEQVYLFYIFAYLPLLLVCTIGNVLNLVILMRNLRNWKTSARCYMLGTAVADLGALWLGLPFCVVNIGIQYNLPFENNSDVTTKLGLLGGCTAWFQQICMQCSDWILVAFSWERLLIVISPFRFRPLQRVSTAWIIIAILLVVALPIGVFPFVGSYLYYADRIDDVLHPTRAPVWFTRWLKMDGASTVIVQIVTFILILIPSVCLIVFLSRQHRSTISQMRLQQLQSWRSRSSLKQNDSSPGRSDAGTTLILLSSSALYLVTRFPMVVESCLFSLSNLHYDWTVEMVVGPFVDIAMYAGYSFTFFTYLVTTRNFREHFFKLFTSLMSMNGSYVYHTGSWWFCMCFETGLSTSASAA
ncbi:uncharacterized protein LOC129595639 [Paramacrobiotus metropolitanus]|uniref:uncharacterized protein LOC129595639 n=1 Tax=Paramacrobiotus metropolitanus TaxID=2943436 RepID=UPI002445E104|nr:uncharacterized protein LOC129595639 [Paramacrobiotus metropolitanus]